MVSTRLTSLAVCAGLVAGALGCSAGEEVTSTGGPPASGTTVLRFAGTSIIAEPAGADAAVAVGGLIGPPPTPSTTTTSTTAPPATTAPPITAPPVTQGGGFPPPTAAPTTTPQTVTYTIAPPPTPAPTLPPTTLPSKPPPIPLDPNSLTPDEKSVLAKINAKKGGAPLTLEQAATTTAKKGAQQIAATKAQYSFPGSIFDHVNASYTQLTTGTFYASTVDVLGESAGSGLAATAAGMKYIGLSMTTVNGNPWVMVILGS